MTVTVMGNSDGLFTATVITCLGHLGRSNTNRCSPIGFSSLNVTRTSKAIIDVKGVYVKKLCQCKKTTLLSRMSPKVETLNAVKFKIFNSQSLFSLVASSHLMTNKSSALSTQPLLQP
jgi:hypothetical protein